jgi:hypothetical protein
MNIDDYIGVLVMLVLIGAGFSVGFSVGSPEPMTLNDCILRKLQVERAYRCVDMERFISCAEEVESPKNLELYGRICADKPVDPLQ